MASSERKDGLLKNWSTLPRDVTGQTRVNHVLLSGDELESGASQQTKSGEEEDRRGEDGDSNRKPVRRPRY